MKDCPCPHAPEHCPCKLIAEWDVPGGDEMEETLKVWANRGREMPN